MEHRINIHSSLRSDGTSYNFNYPIRGQIQNIKKVAVKDVLLINSFANINSTNKQISLIYDATTYNISIQEGNYTITQLMTEIKSYLPATVTITYSSITNKITIDSGAGHTINLTTGTNTLGPLIGFTTADLVASQTYISNGYLDLSPRKSVYIYSSLTNEVQIDGKKTQILTKVVLNNDFGILITSHVGNEKDWIKLNNQEISGNINISLRDEQGNILDNGGYDWELTLITSNLD